MAPPLLAGSKELTDLLELLSQAPADLLAQARSGVTTTEPLSCPIPRDRRRRVPTATLRTQPGTATNTGLGIPPPELVNAGGNAFRGNVEISVRSELDEP